MKILLSAYACEPDKGSEPGVGWNWAIELIKQDNDIWVLTRTNNRTSIDKEFSVKEKPENLHFLYYDLPQWIRYFKKGNRGIHLYYLLWQLGAYKAAKQIHKNEKFDIVHHITFVSARHPSFMGGLGIPFVFGPIAGGERTPWHLRYHFALRGFIVDVIRDLSNLLIRFDPLMRRTFRQAEKIYVTSEQTKKILPPAAQHKTKVQLAIGIDDTHHHESFKKITPADFRILYAGLFLYRKGMWLGIQAFARLLEKVPKARLTMVGKGPNGKKWKELAESLNIAHRIDWIPWLDREALLELYRTHDIFLFPSLRDSGGMVVLEAMKYGLPILCLDLGGPGVMVDHSCGIKIDALHKTEEQVIQELSVQLIKLSSSFSFRKKLSTGAVKRASSFSWKKQVAQIYGKNKWNFL